MPREIFITPNSTLITTTFDYDLILYVRHRHSCLFEVRSEPSTPVSGGGRIKVHSRVVLQDDRRNVWTVASMDEVHTIFRLTHDHMPSIFIAIYNDWVAGEEAQQTLRMSEITEETVLCIIA